MYYALSLFFFFKQKTAYDMRISDWSSDVCSSDLASAGCKRTGRASLPCRDPRGLRNNTATLYEDHRFTLRSSYPALAGAVQSLNHSALRAPALPRDAVSAAAGPRADRAPELGRASCRNRVCQYV